MEKIILSKTLCANFAQQLEIAIEYNTLFVVTGNESMQDKSIDLAHNLIFDFIEFLGLDGTDEDIVDGIGIIVFEEIRKRGFLKSLNF